MTNSDSVYENPTQQEPEKNEESDIVSENERLKAEIQLLRDEKNESDRRSRISRVLAEKGIPDVFAAFITESASDGDIESRAGEFAKAFADETAKIKNTFAQTVTPLSGGRLRTLTREQFLKMPMSERQRLFETDRELYFELVK